MLIFSFKMVTCPAIAINGVNVSQLIGFARACSGTRFPLMHHLSNNSRYHELFVLTYFTDTKSFSKFSDAFKPLFCTKALRNPNFTMTSIKN